MQYWLYEKRLFIILIVFCFNSGLLAQNLPEKVLQQPAKYNLPKHNDDLEPVSDNERLPYVPWKICSDRENNRTSSSPGGSRNFRILGFLEEFYVVDEKGGQVRIVKDPSIDRITLSSQAQDYGWVDKSKMILWRRCLVTPKGQINKKAMILNTIDQLKKTDGSKPDIVEFRSTPSKSGSKTGKKSKLFEIFFIYKSIDIDKDGEADFYLLGRNPRIPDNGIVARKNAIFGWAPSARLTFWNTRVALEPNWDPQAVSERKAKQNAKFFVDQLSATRYKRGDRLESSKILWESDPLGDRPIGEWRRFPILRYLKNGMVTAGVMGEIFSGGVSSGLTPEDLALIQKKLDLLQAKKRFVNVIFVIDGTSSMGAYFGEISKAVRQSIDELQQSNTLNKFKFGAVIYRDWASGMKKLTEVVPIGGDVSSFLNNAKAGFDQSDPDNAEAVYYGMQTGLRGTGLTQNETNVVILIGDAGNHHRNDPSQVNESAIIQQILRLNANLLVFQVHNSRNSNTYNEFIEQAKSIIMTSAAQDYRSSVGIATALQSSVPEPSWSSNNNLDFSLKGGTYYGQIFGLAPGSVMEPQALSNKISEFIRVLNVENDKLIAAIEQFKFGGNENIQQHEQHNNYGEFSMSLASGIIQFLKQSGLTENQIRQAQKDNYQIYVYGTATMSVKDQKYPLFKKVFFVSRRELGKLLDTMYELADNTSGAGIRESLVENWKSLVKGLIGEGNLDNLSMKELNEMVVGIPPSSKFIQDLSLNDLLDPSKIPEDVIGQYYYEIKKKAEKLGRIFNTDADYPYSFRSNEVRYFWIPTELLP